ncbi:P-loop containing nucleoside triphosphate hydrolase protein [Rhodocollybia butyracea]|uniref:P-loop containing nucleoside triphosphate hydrolase protein n=1 Tax=Rhodocollybia butyracea TaxID=206335 RepID=A0A9P5UFH0_9AGAR|nr:P-loop containing nucleoside triphosphate hydrolase protein [Rhodocollybia butyracea]
MLPAGTIQVELGNASDISYPGNPQVAAEDGWYPVSDFNLELSPPKSRALIQSINFLTRYRFIFATYKSPFPFPNPHLVIRIYIIPFDLPGVHGCLTYHVRKSKTPQVLSMARQYMSALLPQIVQDQASWNCGLLHSEFSSPILECCSDQRTLSEIYSNLPSPSPGFSSFLARRLLDCNDSLDDLGLRSTLLRYQRESVAAMLEREQPSQSGHPNPLYVPLKGLDGRTFFYQPGKAEVLQEQSFVSLSPGGLLCEELGAGKTVIILALIIGTMKQLSRPEESVLDTQTVLTPLAFRHFPGQFSSIRKRLSYKAKTPPGVPSFRELLLHHVCTEPDLSATSPAREEHFSEMLEQIPYYSTGRKLNIPFYFHFKEDYSPKTDIRKSLRIQSDSAPRLMYLSSATLIVVPPNLVSQWDQEIHKHCEQVPRVLIVRPKTALPPAKKLAADYDIILMTVSRFCDEDRKAKLDNAHTRKVCECAELPDSRIPDCKCKLPELSPLLQIRWKRLVIDEGHVSSSPSTRLTPFSQLLSVQARWVVSGTPTTNLLGLGLGGSGTKDEDDAIIESGIHTQPMQPLDPGDIDSLFDDADSLFGDTDSLFGDSVSEESSLISSPSHRTARIWSESDKSDINKLMNMISRFIGVKFLADAQTIQTNIRDALFPEGVGKSAPYPGAIDMLVQVMSTLMIRHRIADVEKEITLPPLTQESVLLDLEPCVVISYNALQAGIMFNAIDSERKDQDYFFHPTSAKYLQQVMQNMSQLMFWHVDAKLYNAEELSVHIKKTLLKVKDNEKHISDSDLFLAQRALHHIDMALQTHLWRQIQFHVYIPYQVSKIPLSIRTAWSRLSQSQPEGLIHSDRLIKLREKVTSSPLITEEKLCSLGTEISEADLLDRRLGEELEEKTSRRKGKSARQHAAAGISMGTTDKSPSSARRNESAVRIAEMQQELHARREAMANEEKASTTIRIPESSSVLLRQSPLAEARVVKTASSKLNFIIEEVQKYSAEEKFLIFSDSPLTLSHVHEALDLIQIKSLPPKTQISQLVREQYVLTFETSDDHRVFLMELKHGARGLNLVSASRVIFCEPVWQADVESQAIKRAHRIGQVKPVSVKTLVIRGTAEEKMLERRQELKKSGGKVPKLLEESGMRHFIEYPEFLELGDHSGVATPSVDFPLFRLPPTKPSPLPTPVQKPSRNKRVRLGTPLPVQSPPSKRVHFG